MNRYDRNLTHDQLAMGTETRYSKIRDDPIIKLRRELSGEQELKLMQALSRITEAWPNYGITLACTLALHDRTLCDAVLASAACIEISVVQKNTQIHPERLHDVI